MPTTTEVNIRDHVVSLLKPLLPKKWNLKPHAGQKDDIRTVTVLLSLKSYERNPQNPRGPRLVRWTFTVLDPMTVDGDADDALDEDIIKFLDALDAKTVRQTGLTWSKAERGVALNKPGFDIEITFPINPQPES